MYKMECYSSVKRNVHLKCKFTGKQMDLESIILSKSPKIRKINQLLSHIQIRAYNGQYMCVNNCKQVSQQLERNSSVRRCMQTGGRMSRGGEHKVNYFSSYTSIIVFSLFVVGKYIHKKSLLVKLQGFRMAAPTGGKFTETWMGQISKGLP